MAQTMLDKKAESSVKAPWPPEIAAEFEREYLDELPALVAKSREALEELERFLRKVRSACE